MKKALLAVVAILATALPIVTTAPASAALPPAPPGGYGVNSPWAYSADPAFNLGSHVVRSGSLAGDVAFVPFQTDVRLEFYSSPATASGTQQWVNGRVTGAQLTLNGIPGADLVDGKILCLRPDLPNGWCSVPSRAFTVSLNWTAMAQSGPCVREAVFATPPVLPNCPEAEVTGSATRTYLPTDDAVPPDPDPVPVAGFDWEVTDAGTREVTFTDTSTDPVGAGLEYAWDFGDGATSDEASPVHRFAEDGEHEVTLEVTDDEGEFDTVTQTITLDAGLVVNSTGDLPAEDPEAGCDTGGEVDEATECTLRAAIEAANAAGGGDITFDIEGSGVPTIELTRPLPDVRAAHLTIAGASQEAGQVAVHGTGADQPYVLDLNGGSAEIAGLVLDRAEVGVSVSGGVADLHDLVIGTDPTGTDAGDISVGVRVHPTAGSVTVRDSVIVADAGVTTQSAGTSVVDNRIGTDPTGGTAVGDGRAGVVVVAPDAVVSGNTISAETVGVAVLEINASAAGAEVAGNRVGVSAGGELLTAPSYGIRVDGASGAQVTDNTLLAATAGIAVTGRFSATAGEEIEFADYGDEPSAAPVTGGDAVVRDNRLGPVTTGVTEDYGMEHGVLVWAGAERVTVEANTVDVSTDDGASVLIDGGARHAVTGNTVSGGARGLHLIDTPGATASANTVVGTSAAGLEVSGDSLTVHDNVVGTRTRGGVIVGNGGDGIRVIAGPATVRDNEVVGSSDDGIVVSDDVVATLRGNRIARTAGTPIVAPEQAPEAPERPLAIRTSLDGSDRTTLILPNLPKEQLTIEVFTNASCADGEAERAIGVTKVKAEGTAYGVVQLIDQPSLDHFTITVTDTAGRTSELSDCETIQTYPDTDGDGSVDPIDALSGRDDDPTNAVIVTDTGELLLVTVMPFDEKTGIGGGRLTASGAVDDPDKGGHPAGMSLTYGVLSFVVEGIEPGGTTLVGVTTLDGEAPIRGSHYYKYGADTAGADPGWFLFDGSGGRSGAILSDAYPVAGGDIKKSWILVLTDGERGDVDGFRDGRITDPGGPADLAVAPPTEPVDVALPAAPTPASAAGDELPGTGAPTPWWLGPLGALIAVLGWTVVTRQRPRVTHSQH